MFAAAVSGEGPSFGGSRSAAGPADDDVAVVDAIESGDEVDGDYDEDADYDELESEFIASDDGDDEIDDGDSEDEGVRPRRVVSVDFDERRDGGAGRGDEGDDVGPSERYEWREVPVDGYARRKREEIPAVARDWQARPSSEGRGEGTSGCVASDAESILRGETLRLSHLVEKKERRRENEAIIEALADSRENNREQDMSEVTRIRLESDLLTLQAEVDRLRTSEAEARGERDGAFAERAASMAQVDELRARLRSFEAPAQVAHDNKDAKDGQSIDDDVLMEIVSRLPPKPQTRFKSVSKTWHSLVSSIILHSKPESPLSGLFIQMKASFRRTGSTHYLPIRDDDDETYTDPTFSFLPSHPPKCIVDSRDGFILLSSSPTNSRQNKYSLCNPVTRQWLSLPLPPIRVCRNSAGSLRVHVALVFDDPKYLSSREFKVIRFCSGPVIDMVTSAGGEDYNPLPHRGVDLCVDIYSSKTGQWAQSKASVKNRPTFYLLDWPPVLFDGAIYLSAAPQQVLRYLFKRLEFWLKDN
ncbi:hypothetical protein AAC387_Pa07g2321 [Persea americana]